LGQIGTKKKTAEMMEEDAISAVRKGENLTVQDVTNHVQRLCVRLENVLGQGDYPGYATHGNFGHTLSD